MRSIPRISVTLCLLGLAPMLLATSAAATGGGYHPDGGFLKELAEQIHDLDERISDLESCGCDGILAPVCGENHRTFINECEATCAGVGVSQVGLCPLPVCGGDTALECEDGSFCEVPAGCDEADVGRCIEKPEVCTQEYAPVCGCDGTTYANDCQRRQAGIGLEHRGECDDTPLVCDTNDDCAGSEFCKKPGGMCDVSGGGVCEERPQICTREYAPVCGCDGETYANPCEAYAAGASIESRGECEKKVYVCHVPGGDWHKRNTIHIGVSAAPAHLRHGDYLGKCIFDDQGKHKKHKKHKHEKHQKYKKSKR